MSNDYKTDPQLVEELGTVFHKAPTDEETHRGCEAIEELMMRERVRQGLPARPAEPARGKLSTVPENTPSE